jgi:hypothetical protein
MCAKTVCVLDGRRDVGETADSLQALDEALSGRGWRTAGYRLAELDVAPCRGCFACWVRTPGVCIVDDVGREIAQSVIRSDVLVLLTPITFGGYSSALKGMVDRLIPLILPYFERIDGEVHHVKRYERYPSLLGIGLLPNPAPEQERTFRTVVERNGINLHAPTVRAQVVYDGADAGEAIVQALLRELR